MPRPDVTREDLVDAERLQAELERVLDDEEPALAVTALCYVLTSIIAQHATSAAGAERALAETFAAVKMQLRAFGIGRRHP